MYCNRLEWLKEQWKKTQWEIPELRRCLHEKAAKNSIDCLHGIVAGTKDIAFMDAYYLNNTVVKSGIDPDDLVLVCPDGSTVNYAQPRAHQACNFGRIASRALVIHENQDAKWRWQVTKAFLEAQEHSFFAGNQNDDFHVSGGQDDGIFGKECESLKPISLVNQTYQTWLGPMFLRSMEGLLQKPVQNGGYMSYDDDECQDCETQGQRTNIYRRGYTTDDPHMKGPHMKGGVGPHMKGPRMNGGDGTSASRSRLGDPHQKGPHMKGGVGPHMKGPRMNGGDGTSARRSHLGDPHQKGPHMKGGVGPHMKGPRMNGGDGTSGRRSRLGDPHQKGPHMKGGVGPHMKGPRMNGGDGTSATRSHVGDPRQMRPRMDGGDVAYARRGHNIRRPAELPMRALMYFWKPRGKYPLPISPVGVQEEPPLTDLNIHDVEVGPTVRDAKWPREEFYTKVVYERNGTCSAILRDIACYGDPRTVTRSVGRIGRTMVSIPVCSTAAAFIKTYAQFTCNTGVGYMAPVLMPTRCLYLPCTRQYWIPEWTRDEYWKEEGNTRGKDPQVESQVWKQRHV